MPSPEFRTKSHFLKNLDLKTVLEPESNSAGFTATKLIVTIGPSCQDVDTLAKMLEEGASAARVDLKWAPLDYHLKSLENLQQASRRVRKLCATMVDVQGREVVVRRNFKIGADNWPTIQDAPMKVVAGATITLSSRPDAQASDTLLPLNFAKFPAMCQEGDTIYVGRYLVSGAESASLFCEVQSVTETDVVCVAKNDAVLDGLLTVFHTERSSDSLSNLQNDLPLLSDYDRQSLAIIGQRFDIDFVSLSYCRTAEDVKEARAFLDSIGLTSTKIIAKIETRQALLNYQGILNEANGVIISRGNLGLDCLPEKMALVQKSLIQYSNMVGKVSIITRVVDTMVNTPRPTRAEATDVANAVLDGLDGILLGAETLRGKYPVETLRTVASICRAAEKVFDHHHHSEHLMEMAIEVSAPVVVPHADTVNDDYHEHSNSSVDGLAPKSVSYSSLNNAIYAMTRFTHHASVTNLPAVEMDGIPEEGTSNLYLHKLESIASSAVRAADKVNACLIVVYTHTGKTAELVAKYRPPMPILTLVVPHLVSDHLRWKLEGRHNARQCLLHRGLMPLLAAPSPSGDQVLEEAVSVAGRMGLVQPHRHVVCVQRIHDDFCVKIVAIDELGVGIKRGDGTAHGARAAGQLLSRLRNLDAQQLAPTLSELDESAVDAATAFLKSNGFAGVLSPAGGGTPDQLQDMTDGGELAEVVGVQQGVSRGISLDGDKTAATGTVLHREAQRDSQCHADDAEEQHVVHSCDTIHMDKGGVHAAAEVQPEDDSGDASVHSGDAVQSQESSPSEAADQAQSDADISVGERVGAAIHAEGRDVSKAADPSQSDVGAVAVRHGGSRVQARHEIDVNKADEPQAAHDTGSGLGGTKGHECTDSGECVLNKDTSKHAAGVVEEEDDCGQPRDVGRKQHSSEKAAAALEPVDGERGASSGVDKDASKQAVGVVEEEDDCVQPRDVGRKQHSSGKAVAALEPMDGERGAGAGASSGVAGSSVTAALHKLPWWNLTGRFMEGYRARRKNRST